LQAPGIVGGGLEKASSLLPQLQKYDPVGYHLAKARIDQKNGNIDDAEKELRSAVEKGPGKVDPLLALAAFLASEGRYEESDKLFAQAGSIQPLSQRVLFEQAQSDIWTKRNLDQARDLLKQYIASTALTPNDPPRWEALKLLKKTEAS
jgi:Tfp pilus assembly protein PilF